MFVDFLRHESTKKRTKHGNPILGVPYWVFRGQIGSFGGPVKPYLEGYIATLVKSLYVHVCPTTNQDLVEEVWNAL